MKMFLVDVNNNQTKVVDAEGLQDYYQLIGCELVDIVFRRIGGKWFNIICDDEGALKRDPKISAIDSLCNAMLVGNLLIASGEINDDVLVGLDEKDVEHLEKHVAYISTRKYPVPYVALTECNY